MQAKTEPADWPDTLDVEASGNPMSRTVTVGLPQELVVDAVTDLARKVYTDTGRAYQAFERLQWAAHAFEIACSDNWTTLLDPGETPGDVNSDRVVEETGTERAEAQRPFRETLLERPKLYLSPTEARRIGVALFEAAWAADRLTVVS